MNRHFIWQVNKTFRFVMLWMRFTCTRSTRRICGLTFKRWPLMTQMIPYFLFFRFTLSRLNITRLIKHDISSHNCVEVIVTLLITKSRLHIINFGNYIPLLCYIVPKRTKTAMCLSYTTAPFTTISPLNSFAIYLYYWFKR